MADSRSLTQEKYETDYLRLTTEEDLLLTQQADLTSELLSTSSPDALNAIKARIVEVREKLAVTKTAIRLVKERYQAQQNGTTAPTQADTQQRPATPPAAGHAEELLDEDTESDDSDASEREDDSAIMARALAALYTGNAGTWYDLMNQLGSEEPLFVAISTSADKLACLDLLSRLGGHSAAIVASAFQLGLSLVPTLTPAAAPHAHLAVAPQPAAPAKVAAQPAAQQAPPKAGLAVKAAAIRLNVKASSAATSADDDDDEVVNFTKGAVRQAPPQSAPTPAIAAPAEPAPVKDLNTNPYGVSLPPKLRGTRTGQFVGFVVGTALKPALTLEEARAVALSLSQKVKVKIGNVTYDVSASAEE